MRRYRIGRAATNDIVVAEESISREHAELVELGGGRFQIKDLGSSSGTSIWQGQDWTAVTEAELRHDSQLRLGQYQTTVEALLRETDRGDPDRTVVRPRATDPTPPPAPTPPVAPPPAAPKTAPTEPIALEVEVTQPPQSTAIPPESPSQDLDRTEIAQPRPAPSQPAAPRPAAPRPASPKPAPPKPAPPQPAGPAFQFLKNLPPEKRTLLWLGVGFAGFLLISLITLILALVL